MITADTINSRATTSDALLRRLHLIAQGKEAQHADRITIATATLDGILLGRGFVRTVKHRNGTRSYALTDLGREILNARAKESK